MYPYVQFAMEWPGDLHPRIYDPKELPNEGRHWSREMLRTYSPCVVSCFIVGLEDEVRMYADVSFSVIIRIFLVVPDRTVSYKGTYDVRFMLSLRPGKCTGYVFA